MADTITCPYCAEPVNEGAAVCKTCRRDIALVASLTAAKHALEEKVHELEAELEAFREGAAAEVAAPLDETPPPRPRILDILAIYLLLPTVALIGVHYLLVIKLDTSLVWLRATSIVLPVVVGLVLDRKILPRWLLTLALGISVGFLSVLGMSTMVHLTDGDPILPHTAHAWRETLEYVTSIALSYMLGALLGRVLRPRKSKGVRADGKIAALAAFVARHISGNKKKPKTLEEQVKQLVKLVNLGISIATALGAVYTGFKGIL